jgi:hypothetical protein
MLVIVIDVFSNDFIPSIFMFSKTLPDTVLVMVALA